MSITVYDVLFWLVSGMTYDEIVDDYSKLNRNDILACLVFVADKKNTPILSYDEVIIL